MQQNPISPNESLIPPPQMDARTQAFAKQYRGMLDGQPKDDETCAEAFEGMEDVFDLIAAGLYSIASMLVGEGEESVRLVETAVATAEVSACQDHKQAKKSGRRALATLALKTLEQREPGCLAAPEGPEPTDTCIEDDELQAAGVSSEELEHMIAGPDRDRVRTWVAGLPTGLRTVFVLRAVAGMTTGETAELLVANGGPKAEGWTPSGVSQFFRQALCSLASQLIHASAGK